MPLNDPDTFDSSDKLDSLVAEQTHTLFTANTVFPFTLFPSTVSVDKNKVDIVQRFFFSSGGILSVLIEDIARIEVQLGVLFGTLIIKDKTLTQRQTKIPYLWKNHAIKIREIVEGLIIGEREHIDIKNVHPKELVSRLERIGRAKAKV
jgi:hypothetical protein